MEILLTSKELSAENWPDLVQLFGKRGASGGCWCMFFREPFAEFKQNIGETNRDLFRQVVESRQPTGLLAYQGIEPVGWIAVSPRENYITLKKSRNYHPVDDQPVWSITCFFTARKFRRTGVTRFLIQEAIQYVKAHGGTIVEAYPVESKAAKMNDLSAYKGIYQVFLDLGFQEVARRYPSAPIVRYPIP